MKLLLFILFLIPAFATVGQDTTPTLKSVLLEQLKSTHNVKNWFVPVNDAVAGLTVDQASWTEKEGNHSVGQLAYHLLFWNTRILKNLKGEKADSFSGNNTETFDKFDQKQWNETILNLDQVLADIEKLVSEASDTQLKEWATTIANVSAHNAYHVGQIIYIRKLQGSWDPEKGVK